MFKAITFCTKYPCSGAQSVYLVKYLVKDDTKILADLYSQDAGAISPLFLNVTFENEKQIRIRITDKNKARYEVPYPDPTTYKTQADVSDATYEVLVSENFGIKITRKINKQVIFDTTNHKLVFTGVLLFLSFLLLLFS